MVAYGEPVGRMALRPDEVDAVQAVVEALGSPPGFDEHVLLDVGLAAHELPRRLRSALVELRTGDGPDALVVSTSAAMVTDAGPTPVVEDNDRAPSLPDLLLLLFASLVGDPIAWENCKGGRLVQDVMPLARAEGEPTAVDAGAPVRLHTEDAFNVLSPDFVVLLCVRNDDRVPTTLSCASSLGLDDGQFDVLFDTHLRLPVAGGEDAAGGSEDGEDAPYASRPVLYGERRRPCFGYWPDTFRRPDDPVAATAFAALEDRLFRASQEIPLDPGDICVVDNSRAAHGRPAYRPAYDGRDRWLKRACVTLDLRKLSPYRSGRVLQEA